MKRRGWPVLLMTWNHKYQHTFWPRPGTSTLMRRGSLNLKSSTQSRPFSALTLSGSSALGSGLTSRSLGWAASATETSAAAATGKRSIKA